MQGMDYIGKRVVDRANGLKGTCIGIAKWLFGCEIARVVFCPRKKTNYLHGKMSEDGINLKRLEVHEQVLELDGYFIDPSIEAKYLGKEVRDKVNGFQGIVTGIYFEIYSTPVLVIEAKCGEDGKANDNTMVDLGRVEIIGEGIKPEEVEDQETHRTGGGILPQSIRDLVFG